MVHAITQAQDAGAGASVWRGGLILLKTFFPLPAVRPFSFQAIFQLLNPKPQ